MGFWNGPRRYRLGGPPLSSLAGWGWMRMEGFIVQKYCLLFSSGGAGSINPSTSPANQSMELWFLHHAGRYPPGGQPLSPPVRWSCRCIKLFIILAWARLFSPGGAGSLARQQRASGVPHRGDRYRRGDRCYRSWSVLKLCKFGSVNAPEMEPYISRMAIAHACSIWLEYPPFCTKFLR